MSVERRLLAAACKDRGAYNTIARHVTPEEWTDAAKVVINAIDEYYQRDAGAGSVVLATLNSQIVAKLNNPKHKTTFSNIIEAIGTEDISAVNVVEEVLAAKREALGAKISVALAGPGGGKDTVRELMRQYEELVEASTLGDSNKELELLAAPSLDALFDESAERDLIKIAPASLNKRLRGGLLRGHHMTLFARPEMGKTMFLVNLVAGFLKQGLVTLYLGNEEPIEDVVVRIVGRLADMSSHDVLGHRKDAMDAAYSAGYSNLRLKRMTPGTLREIEELVAEVKPDVLIVDQMRNVSTGGKEDSMTRNLEKVANGIRQIAGKYHCLAVSVTQAGDSASGRAVLDMGDVDSSNTGIPGACDVMIGLGATDEDINAGRRVISIAKNKRSGDHSFFPVRVDTTRSKIASMETL